MTARLRPRFRMRVDLDADRVMDIFTAEKEAGRAPCVLHLYEHQVEFSIVPEHRHFWSPFLNLVIEKQPGGAALCGKYGPNVNVWTMFLALYAVCTITGLVGLVVAWSQSLIGQPSSGLWLTGACVATTAVVYAVGRIGRSLAHPQMVVFHDYIEATFGAHVLELRDEETD